MPLLRIQNLHAVDQEKEMRPDAKLADAALWHPTLEMRKVDQSTGESRPIPTMSYENETAFGKISISDIPLDVWNPAKQMLYNAVYRIDSYKESKGISTFKKEEADKLLEIGIFAGEQWRQSSPDQLIKYSAPGGAAYGSLTFTAPVEAWDLMTQVPAFNALMALATIASILGPIERDVSLIVSGALEGIFTDESDLGRPFLQASIGRALLKAHQLARTTRGNDVFDRFISDCIREAPAPIRKFCARETEDVRALGIDGSQLASIAEWAFNITSPRTLILNSRVEVLAAIAVSSFFRNRRLALVDCEARTCERFDDRGSARSPRLAIFHGGDAQQAVEVLHRINWLQPVFAESKRTPGPHPHMRLSCTIEEALSACPAFLRSAGVSPEDAAYFIDAAKKDALAKFSRDVVLLSEELPGQSYTSEDNLVHSYSYEMREEPRDYDWNFWLGFHQTDIRRIILQQPRTATGVSFGSSTFYGYSGQAITKRVSLGKLHEDYKNKLESGYRFRDSDVSAALAEVAGLIFALAMSGVHILDQLEMRKFKISVGLGSGLKEVYSMLCNPDNLIVPRSLCIGILARVWLDVYQIVDLGDVPTTSLGISNSRGAVMSAVFGHTKSLFEATTKFIVSTDVPDIVAGEQPVIACASTPVSKVQRRGYEVELKPLTKSPYDGCWQISCLTVTGGDPPAVSGRMANRVSVVPVCGYIACGARWWEYIDLDKAFAVMSESQSDSACASCPSEAEGCWLPQEDFLRRDEGGFICALPQTGDKVILPADQNGLMQSFLCGIFKGTASKLRWRCQQCVAHTDCDVLIV